MYRNHVTNWSAIITLKHLHSLDYYNYSTVHCTLIIIPYAGMKVLRHCLKAFMVCIITVAYIDTFLVGTFRRIA